MCLGLVFEKKLWYTVIYTKMESFCLAAEVPLRKGGGDLRLRGDADEMEKFFRRREKEIKKETCSREFGFVPVYVIVLLAVVCICGLVESHIRQDRIIVSPELELAQPEESAEAEKSTAGYVKIDLNSASEEGLQTIPGIGVVRAARIVETREKLGKFRSVDDLLNVEGFGEKLIESIRDYVFVVY